MHFGKYLHMISIDKGAWSGGWVRIVKCAGMHSEHQKQQNKGHSVLLKERDSDILQINVQKRSGN